MAMVKTILAFALTVFIIIFCTPVGVIIFFLSFLGMKKPMAWVTYKIAQGWAKGIIFITGCTMEVEGRENIPARGSVCFASNHVGIFDVVLALAYIGRPFGFIAKKELLMVPFINLWISILGGLFIDRLNIRKAIKTINEGIKRIQDGNCMLIFPEGTRSKGQGLLPFKSGAVKLATHSFAPIVPIAITGSYNVFEIDYRVHGVPVRMVFCPPIDTSETGSLDRRHVLSDQVRVAIEAALNRQS